MNIFLILLVCLSFLKGAYAEDPNYEMRVSWTKTLKDLMGELEKKKTYELTQSEKKFLQHFEIISSAWAESDSPYNCFYGGWPSIKKGRFCQNPRSVNSSYDKQACAPTELQCQPLLFGKGLCAPGSTQSERNKSFSTCEGKFQKEKNGQYDYLKSLSRSEVQDFQELSLVAGKVCDEKSNSQISICKKIKQKIGDGLKAIDSAFDHPALSESEALPVPVPVPVVSNPTPAPVNTSASPHNETCPEEEHEHGLMNQVKNLERMANQSVDTLYDEIKKKFQDSPFCNPHGVISDPIKKPSPVITNELMKNMGFIDFLKPPGDNLRPNLQKLQAKYNLSDSVLADAIPMIESVMSLPSHDEKAKLVRMKARGLIMQDYLKNYKYDPEFMKSEVQDELVKKHIFKKNEEGKAECPFVTKDAFLKAMGGRDAVLKTQGSKIKNKSQITIVDYSRPSNERRLFVIDLSRNEVLHNTWVAHGAGGDSIEGVDGLGSSPKMSNKSGSNMSSDGFILATRASYGSTFGNNVLLQGIDQNNSNLAARSVIMHKWSSPYTGYSAGVQDYDRKSDSFGPSYDITDRIKSMDMKSASMEEMQNVQNGLYNSVYASSLMSATQGCLGVPLNNIKHLDKKGRDKSQLEALREDLPGSIIFNYSGPQMESRYF